ncbi:hypothetical protein [Crocosphaera watsonii]|uniref:Uncharacterized protein n=2 Tax=Crocosphaera watsonii TaxID=263511 RepID=T2JTA9_CROWT|nr:hypothetical protein [Crocosphaera watsonii]CCQ69078.1 hypothetical protein CWATWH0402_5848 [Crocosphaera watsonii WH 0402]
MSPKPQFRSLKKKATASDKTINTNEVSKEKAVDKTSTKTSAKQSVPSPEEEVTFKETTSTELPSETGDQAKSNLNGKAEGKAETDSQTTTGTGDQSTDNPDADIDKPIFQAIGTIKVKPEEDKENPGQFFIRLGGKRYGLFIAGYRYQAWLKQMAANPDQTLFLRVYPKCLMIPRKPPKIFFQVAAWETENPWDEAPGQFRLKGIWQFVPQVRTPVISVYRNKGAEDPKGKFKASHIPILMRRDDEAAPFRFNPKIAKEDLPPRWFVQGLFKFIPSRDSFGFSEDLEPPTTKIPWYKKPVKAIPGEDSQKGTENKFEKPSGKKLEKPQKKSEQPASKGLEVRNEESKNE